MNDKDELFQEIKQRVVENKFTREDALVLVEMVEEFEDEMDDLAVYLLEELEVQDEV
jgi:hypothetical protein